MRFKFCNFESIVRQHDQQKKKLSSNIQHTGVWIGGITFEEEISYLGSV
jgi:hypothetical protein